jgi:hypothetical protein
MYEHSLQRSRARLRKLDGCARVEEDAALGARGSVLLPIV